MSNESDATSLRMKVQAFLSRDTKMRLQAYQDLDNYVYEQARHSDHLNVPQAVVDLLQPVFLSLVVRYNPGSTMDAARADAEQLLARFMLFLKDDENWAGWMDTNSPLQDLIYNMAETQPLPGLSPNTTPEPVEDVPTPTEHWSSYLWGRTAAVVAAGLAVAILVMMYYQYQHSKTSGMVTTTQTPAPSAPSVTVAPDPGKISSVPSPTTSAPAQQPTVLPVEKPTGVPIAIAQLNQAQEQIKALEERVKKLESAQQRPATRTSAAAKTKSVKRNQNKRGTKMAASTKGCVPYIINAFKGEKPQTGYICP